MDKKQREKNREKAKKQLQEYYKKNPSKKDLFATVFTSAIKQEEN